MGVGTSYSSFFKALRMGSMMCNDSNDDNWILLQRSITADTGGISLCLFFETGAISQCIACMGFHTDWVYSVRSSLLSTKNQPLIDASRLRKSAWRICGGSDSGVAGFPAPRAA